MKTKKQPSLADLCDDADRAKEVWLAHYREHGIGTGAYPSLKIRLANNGLWIRWKNRKKKAEVAQMIARNSVPSN